MTIAGTFIAELQQEAGATRRLLERVPEDKLSWRPHPRSSSLGELALHIAQLPRGITQLVSGPDAEVPNVPRPEATSRAELLNVLEESLAFAAAKLESWDDDALAHQWRLTRGGKTIIELPRAGMIRTVLLNHWYHHRGQLTVYLRLLDVPLPSVYGPSADEPRLPIEE